jgi:hypothetical protein
MTSQTAPSNRSVDGISTWHDEEPPNGSLFGEERLVPWMQQTKDLERSADAEEIFSAFLCSPS